MDVEVQTEKEDDCDEEGDECEENKLLAQTSLFQFNGKLVLLLAQCVSFSFEQGLTNIFHYD